MLWLGTVQECRFVGNSTIRMAKVLDCDKIAKPGREVDADNRLSMMMYGTIPSLWCARGLNVYYRRGNSRLHSYVAQLWLEWFS